MATSTLKSDGTGDYVSMITWETAKQGTLSEPEILECFKGTTVNDGWQADGSLQESVSVADWVTTPTNNIIIRAAAGENHGGVPGVGFRLVGDFTTALSCTVDNTVIEDISLESTAGDFNAGSPLIGNGNNCLYQRLIGIRSGGAINTSRSTFYTSAGSGGTRNTFRNCLAIGGYGGFVSIIGTSNPIYENCTAVAYGDFGFVTGSDLSLIHI